VAAKFLLQDDLKKDGFLVPKKTFIGVDKIIKKDSTHSVVFNSKDISSKKAAVSLNGNKSNVQVLTSAVKKNLISFKSKKGHTKLNVAGQFFTDSSPEVKKELKLGPFTDGLDKAPQISYYEPIEYPAWAERKGIFGEITVKLFIGAEGKIHNIKVMKQTVGKKLSAYVIARMRNWKFNPPLKDGKPTTAWVVQTVNFKFKSM
jgi:TonB family protein